MLKRDYDEQVCSVARSLEVVGERWSLLIARSLWMGVHRFDDLLDALGITRSVLTARLAHLIDEGVIERIPYHERPVRYEYHLTAKGHELWPVVAHLMRWGDKHYAEPAGVPRILEHTACGGHPDDHLMCERCGEPLGVGSVTPRPGPARPTGALGETSSRTERLRSAS